MRRGRIFANGAGSPIDKGPCISRILQDLQDGSNGRFFPDDIPKAISPWQKQVILIEKLHHFIGRSHPKKGRKDEIKAILNLAIGVFMDFANSIAH